MSQSAIIRFCVLLYYQILRSGLQQFGQVSDWFFRFLFCSISGNICYFENWWLVDFFIDHSYLFRLVGPFMADLRSCFQLLFHLFKAELFIFLYTDSHSDMGVSWIIISLISVLLKVSLIEALTLKMHSVSEKKEQPKGFVGLFGVLMEERNTMRCSIFRAGSWTKRIRADKLWIFDIICRISERFRCRFEVSLDNPTLQHHEH